MAKSCELHPPIHPPGKVPTMPSTWEEDLEEYLSEIAGTHTVCLSPATYIDPPEYGYPGDFEDTIANMEGAIDSAAETLANAIKQSGLDIDLDADDSLMGCVEKAVIEHLKGKPVEIKPELKAVG